MNQPTPSDSPRVSLWKLTRETLHRIMRLVAAVETWNSQTLYLACQLNTMAMIVARLKHEEGVVKIGDILDVRVVMDCVANAITGCNQLLYAENGLLAAATPRKDRKTKSEAQRNMLKEYAPVKWKTEEGNVGELLFKRGHAVIHGDADAGFYFRADGLHGRDVTGLAFCILMLLFNVRTYLTGIGSYFTDAQHDEIVGRFHAILPHIVNEGIATYSAPLDPFERRVYEELFKRGVDLNLSEPIRQV
jgi:hypothetical protein